ncbi:MAG: outer membrane protein assembly factor BamB [Aquabacterium sp.]|uniref:outer membrane protein assembly factor BamB n=1 Tax=Aquabacterium sp. TaxID=1872578 RepID=UPI00271FBEEA|nr:outer membrane protein assembly factor BamB [Aquabacterium sp.]MDO9005363.1 outer membrane protein assembly factor BamB [Aquabacterium sp.]
MTLSRRALGATALAVAAALLSACGSTKPKPAPLESFTPSQGITTVWSKRLGSVDGPTSLAVTKDAVTWAASDGQILSADVKTGQERWRAQANAKLSASVGSDGRYAAVVTTDNELITFDQGKVLWRERLPGRVITSPLVAGERVFVQSVDRSVRAYDALDGRWLWNYQRPGGDPLSLSTPGLLSAFRDTLVVGQGARFVGLDPLKGTPRFDFSVGTPRGTNEVERLADLVGPGARADDEICVRAFQLSVACIEMNRGSLRWSRPQSGTQAVAADDTIVVGADGADRLSAWRTENGEIRWRVDRFTHRKLSAPAVWGKLIAVADDDGQLHILASDDGRTVARIALDNALSAAPVVSDGLLLLATRSGTLYALRAN